MSEACNETAKKDNSNFVFKIKSILFCFNALTDGSSDNGSKYWRY